jgi:hypothetical protein
MARITPNVLLLLSISRHVSAFSMKPVTRGRKVTANHSIHHVERALVSFTPVRTGCQTLPMEKRC